MRWATYGEAWKNRPYSSIELVFSSLISVCYTGIRAHIPIRTRRMRSETENSAWKFRLPSLLFVGIAFPLEIIDDSSNCGRNPTAKWNSKRQMCSLTILFINRWCRNWKLIWRCFIRSNGEFGSCWHTEVNKNGVAGNASESQTNTWAKLQRSRSRWHISSERKSSIRAELTHMQCASRPCCRCPIHLQILKNCVILFFFFFFFQFYCCVNSTAPSESPLLLCHTQYWRIEGEARHERNICVYIDTL